MNLATMAKNPSSSLTNDVAANINAPNDIPANLATRNNVGMARFTEHQIRRILNAKFPVEE
jgi:hypothetical protein